MVKLFENFDANNVEPSAPYEIIPPGDYVVQIINSELRDTKTGSGKYLWLDMIIVEGQYENRHIYDRLNLYNENSTAAEIAARNLSAIARAVDKLSFDDTEDLHFLPFIAKVSVRPAGPDKTGVQREAQNEVKGYKPVNSLTQNNAPQNVSANKPTQQRNQTAGYNPPWRRQ